ncbi:hypothetical protein B0J14DRAFT_605739, partial [Halenospora varia]
MPTENDFRAFEATIKNLWRVSERAAAIEKQYASASDRNQFYQWRVDAVRPGGPEPPLSTREILTKLQSTNLRNPSQREAMELAINSGFEAAYLPLGVDAPGNHYRVWLRTNALVVNPTKTDITRTLLPPSILGVNTDCVVSRTTNHRKETSEESNVSNETDDTSTGGFVCFQIGQVESRAGRRADEANYESEEWSYTGFGLVMRFSSNGDSEGLYLLYDFWPEDLVAGNFARDRRISDASWGKLPGFELQFSCAKIAEKEDIENLSEGFKLNSKILLSMRSALSVVLLQEQLALLYEQKCKETNRKSLPFLSGILISMWL